MSIFFWYPVIFNHHGYQPSCSWERALSFVDQYFHLHKDFIFLVDHTVDLSKKKYLYQGTLIKSAPYSKIITALKIFSYLTIIIPLIMLSAKFLLRYPYTFKEKSIFFHCVPTLVALPPVIKPSSKAISISSFIETYFPSTATDPNYLNLEAVTSELYELRDHINQKQAHAKINCYYPATFPNIYFELESTPGIIFKSYSTHNGLLNCCSAKTYIDDYNQIFKKYLKIKLLEGKLKNQNLDLLLIPKHKLFMIKHAGREYGYLGEEKIICPPSIYANEIWQFHDQQLRSAFIQLAKFIEITGLEDINPYNCRGVRFSENKWKLAIFHSDSLLFSNLPKNYYLPQPYPDGISQLIDSLYSTASIQAIIDIFPPETQLALQEPLLLRIEQLQEFSLKKKKLSRVNI